MCVVKPVMAHPYICPERSFVTSSVAPATGSRLRYVHLVGDWIAGFEKGIESRLHLCLCLGFGAQAHVSF